MRSWYKAIGVTVLALVFAAPAMAADRKRDRKQDGSGQPAAIRKRDRKQDGSCRPAAVQKRDRKQDGSCR